MAPVYLRVLYLMALLPVSASLAGSRAADLPIAEANDNQSAAGDVRNDTLRLNLVVQMTRWYPEGPDGPFAEVAAFGEAGRAPQIPGPLIRVPIGTTIVANVLNNLPDSAVWMRGLENHPGTEGVSIEPGSSHRFVFNAGAAGTYLYRATPGVVARPQRVAELVTEQEQLAGAFVVDPVGVVPKDRVLVINIWGRRQDSGRYRNALGINGKAWPYSERFTFDVGDSVRWRVVNGSARRHPMHLHGFYFRVDSKGSMTSDTVFSSDERRLAVTEDMAPFSTMSLVWSPDRPGNWLFHCHLTFHVTERGRLDGEEDAHAEHGADPTKHMAGLVLGLHVKRRVGSTRHPVDWKNDRSVQRLHLFADERSRKGPTPSVMSYVLQRDGKIPSADSVEAAGQPIVLTRGRPTQITVVNRTRQSTSVHWHGIELESYSDGVAGWSGDGVMAPMIQPNDSFVARLTLKRAGTFIYHTHLNDVQQITSGLYGPLLVLPPGETFDRSRDHVFTIGWDGPDNPPTLFINGDSVAGPLLIDAAKQHRLRFVNIGPAGRVVISLRAGSTPAIWRPRAKDGADLPLNARIPGKAMTALSVGETFDAEIDSLIPGEYTLSFAIPNLGALRTRRIVVR